VYEVVINKGIILRCTAYQISRIVASSWLIYLNLKHLNLMSVLLHKRLL